MVSSPQQAVMHLRKTLWPRFPVEALRKDVAKRVRMFVNGKTEANLFIMEQNQYFTIDATEFIEALTTYLDKREERARRRKANQEQK